MNGRLPLLLSSLVLSSLVPATALAAGPDRKACLAAADEGQKLRDDNFLTAAREKFITCSEKVCPAIVSKQCSEWLQEVERDLPTISFRAFDEDRKEILDVRVILDGIKISAAIEAKALSLDPGEHVVKLERADGRAAEQKVLIRTGEKNRIIDISFASVAAPAPATVVPGGPVRPPAAEPKRPLRVPLLGWIGLGVGVAGGVTTALFAMSANSDESGLREKCAPRCDPAERDPIETKLRLANVGLGVGIVGLGVGVVATVLANSGEAKVETSRSSIRFDVSPTGAAALSGTF